jgi:predicted deacylase
VISPEILDPARLIGRRPGAFGTRLIVVAAMHGNEPAGVHAVRAVLSKMEASDLPLRGELVALVGNVEALSRQTRFIETDMNRLWTDDRVGSIRAGTADSDRAEYRELAELLRDLDGLVHDAPDGVIVVDLHTTSGPGAPFACISDTLRSRAIALELPVPLVLGIEEAIHGTMLEYLEEQGRPMVLVEGGQHDAAETVDNLESALWLILEAAGIIATADIPQLDRHRARLRGSMRGLPRVVEVVYRHPVTEDSGFRMRSGLAHFDRVTKGQPLADDDGGTIAAPVDGLLIMPRYQAQGHDGFFIGRAIRRSWLDVSRIARAIGIDRLLPRMPGVSRDPTRPQQLLVDRAVARWFTIQLFHLSGFRRLPDRNGKLVFTRRVEP